LKERVAGPEAGKKGVDHPAAIRANNHRPASPATITMSNNRIALVRAAPQYGHLDALLAMAAPQVLQGFIFAFMAPVGKA
jgi:hypothetical protein